MCIRDSADRAPLRPRPPLHQQQKPRSAHTKRGFRTPTKQRQDTCLLYTSWDVGFLSEERVAIIECNWRQGLLAQVPQGRGYYHELKALCSKL